MKVMVTVLPASPAAGVYVKLNGDEEVVRHADVKEPLAALAFKIATDPYVGRLCFIRVYS